MAVEPVDLEAMRMEEMMWLPLGGLRWRRPSGASDDEKILEQLYERHTGERVWREVKTYLED